MSDPIRIGVLVGGGGRTALNLASHCQEGDVPAILSVVIAHGESLPAVSRCRAVGLRVEVVASEPSATLGDRVDRVLEACGVELVCLAGYLRRFRVDRWAGRALNIHPALLPLHGGTGMYGRRVHEAVLASGEAESGCTVHVVDDIYDHGAILVQRRCPVLPGDTPESLSARVFVEECEAYPAAIRLWASRLRGQ